ncbi:thymidylate kinase-domain-containing protein [Desarmillaria tabescens]|uniref:Thymidylate kinase n=1 Tax=Armillaria tabescens TaxID=1929756 RepID=A0AA39KCE8_ARMTA|nr:thymidylate kinase-domain-containing protein [Desarmillaria tabescens]KAK0457395.1 thymidylate kinase-domain-containing protein [Desarmillaria tabescens]
MTRGAFIVIEGLDRSGKTTQTADLRDKLAASGNAVNCTNFLVGIHRTTSIGKMIDSYLQSKSELDDHAIHLLFSANRWELASTIEGLLESGTTVLCDRYAFSGIAFSASKGLPYEWCRSPDVGLPAPDLVVFLDITPEKARERGGYGNERYEKEEMQQRVREQYKRIESENVVRWATIDAGREREQPLVDGIDHAIAKLWF